MAVSRIPRRPASPSNGGAEARVAALMDAHGTALLRVARHHSLCADDAHDAIQRAVEIYLRRLETVELATEGAWMKVVVRHEAMAVRRARSESVASEDVDFDARPDDASRPVEERLFGAERSARSAEALRRLKPDEARALMLKAEGLSYSEIAERHGWTYTKTNRSITEGRRRFLRAYAELEAKDACDAFGPALGELARGTASAETVIALRPHLRHCPACRATVRELRGGRRRIAAWLPLPPTAWLVRPRRGRVLDRETNAVEAGAGAIGDEPAIAFSPGRWAELKLQVQQLLHRFNGSDVATSVQIASSGGGGRTASIAALIGFCISGVGAGTYCVATKPPKPVERKAEKTPTPRPKPYRPASDPPVQIVVNKPAVTPEGTPARTPTPSRSRRAPERRKPQRERPSTGPTTQAGSATTSSSAPSPVAQGQQEFGFEQTSSSSASSSASSGGGGSAAAPAPAAAPASGGGEFGP